MIVEGLKLLFNYSDGPSPLCIPVARHFESVPIRFATNRLSKKERDFLKIRLRSIPEGDEDTNKLKSLEKNLEDLQKAVDLILNLVTALKQQAEGSRFCLKVWTWT